MFEQFGEFNSSEEINKAADELFNKEDMEGIRKLAAENGIDPEDAEDFVEGVVDELTTPIAAALGKLKVESEALKIKGILQDWTDELKSMCTEDIEFAKAVRKKGKELAGYIAKTAESGYENRVVVDKQIVERAKKIKSVIGNHEFSIGIPDKKTRRELATAYYLG